MLPISVNCVKTSDRSPSAIASPRTSTRRVSLPDRPDKGRAVGQKVRRMVADLLELHHGGQNQTSALDSFCFVDPRQHVVDDSLVQSGLLAGQGAELLHLELFGKVGDDRPIGLEAAE